MREQDVQKKLVKYLEGLGAYTVNVIIASKSGVPDILCCYRGTFIGIEVKRPQNKNNVSKVQRVNLDWIIDAGGLAGVAWDIDSLEEILNDNV